MDNSLSEYFQALYAQYPPLKDLLAQILRAADAVLKGKPHAGQENPPQELLNDLEALANKDIDVYEEIKSRLRGYDKLEKIITVPIEQFIKKYGEAFNEKAVELIEQIRKCQKDAEEIGTEEKIARKLFEDLDEINFDKSQQLLRDYFERDYQILKLTDVQVVERIHKIAKEEDQSLVRIIQQNIERAQLRDAIFALNLIKLTNPELAWKIFTHVKQLRIYLKIDKDELGFESVQSLQDEDRIRHVRGVVQSLTSESLQILNNKLPSPQDQEFSEEVKNYWTRVHKFFGLLNNTLSKFGSQKQELKIQLELLNKQCLNFIKNWYVKISSEYFTHKIKAGFENDFQQLVFQAKMVNKLVEEIEKLESQDIGKTLLNEEDNIFLQFQTMFPSRVNLAPSNNSLVQKIIRLFEKENQLLIEVIKNKKLDLNKYQFKDEDQITHKKKEIEQVKQKVADMKGKIARLEQKLSDRLTQNPDPDQRDGYLTQINQEYEQQIEIKKLKINQLKDYKSLLKQDVSYLEKECNTNDKFCKTNREKISADIEQDQNKLSHNQDYLQRLYRELNSIKDAEMKKLQQIQSFIGNSDTSMYNEIYNLIFSLQQKTRFFQEYTTIIINKIKITIQAIFTAQKILEQHENEINQNELANSIIVQIRNDLKINLQTSKDAHNIRQLLFYFYSDGKGEINNEQELCIKIIAKNFLIREIRAITDEDAMIDSIEKFLIFELFDGNREQKYERFMELKRKKNDSSLDDKELKLYSELMNDEPLRKCIMELTKHKSQIKMMSRKLAEEFNKYEDLTQQKIVQEHFKTNLIQMQKIIVPALNNSLLMFKDLERPAAVTNGTIDGERDQ